MSHPSARQRQRTLAEAYAALEAVRARLARLRYRDAAAEAERDALEAELWDAENELLAAGRREGEP